MGALDDHVLEEFYLSKNRVLFVCLELAKKRMKIKPTILNLKSKIIIFVYYCYSSLIYSSKVRIYSIYLQVLDYEKLPWEDVLGSVDDLIAGFGGFESAINVFLFLFLFSAALKGKRTVKIILFFNHIYYTNSSFKCSNI